MAIRRGAGEIEWQDRTARIRAGTAFLLLPGEWHRYRPLENSGWAEDWIELRGVQIGQWVERGLFRERIFLLPAQSSAWARFRELHRLACGNQLGPAGKLAGLAMSLLAEVTQTGAHRQASMEDPAHRIVPLALESLQRGEGVRQTAEALGVSYPTLYRYFHVVLGLSPKQFEAQYRRARAETLIANGALSIKEIAAELGYNSPSHFSLAFKKACGVSPLAWRKSFPSTW